MSRARDLGSSINSTAAGKNVIINGGMDIWQRATSFTPSTGQVYTADRWFTWSNYTGNPITVSRQLSGLTGIQYCMRVQRNSGTTQGTSFFLNSALETANCYQFAGQYATFSGYYRKGVDFTGNSIQIYIQSGTANNESGIGGFSSNNSNPIGGTIYPTTSWQRFTFTGLIPSTTTQMEPVWYTGASGIAGANDYYEITGLQLEIGSSATPFSRSGGNIQGELALCQRYYWKFNSDSASGNYMPFGAGHGIDANNARAYFSYPVQMRISPSMSFSAASTFQKSYGTAMTSISVGEIGISSGSFNVVKTNEFAFNHGILITAANNKTAYIELSAEL